MTVRSTDEDLAAFLTAHAPIRSRTLVSEGERVGAWRVTAFLGKGGSGEVYRVEREGATLGSGEPKVAALKVLARTDEVARARFQREMELLSQNAHAAFPRFYGAGALRRSAQNDGVAAGEWPYYAMELLAPVELPSRECDVAEYLLSVARAVSILHRHGFVHRDIKPQNILRRANGELVLSDLGLVKAIPSADTPAGSSVTLVGGKAVGAGTPRYAAPEQFNGGEVSPATDVHALGMLANECFGGHPPRAWERIISRSTSSIPERRYGDIDAFERAIRHRHYARRAAWGGLVLAGLVGAVAVVIDRAAAPVRREPPHIVEKKTNVVVREALYEKTVTNRLGKAPGIERAWREKTNAVPGGLLRLDNRKLTYSEPLRVKVDRPLWIIGPGTLDAPIEGERGAKVHLDNCMLVNRTAKSVASNGLKYVFGKGVYLNFPNLRRNENLGHLSYMENLDGANSAVTFGGPETVQEWRKQRAAEIREEMELESR